MKLTLALTFFFTLTSSIVNATDFDSSCQVQSPFTLCDKYTMLFYEHKDLINDWNDLVDEYYEINSIALQLFDTVQAQNAEIKKLKMKLNKKNTQIKNCK